MSMFVCLSANPTARSKAQKRRKLPTSLSPPSPLPSPLTSKQPTTQLIANNVEDGWMAVARWLDGWMDGWNTTNSITFWGSLWLHFVLSVSRLCCFVFQRSIPRIFFFLFYTSGHHHQQSSSPPPHNHHRCRRHRHYHHHSHHQHYYHYQQHHRRQLQQQHQW